MLRIEYFENDFFITKNNKKKKLSAYNLNTVLSIIVHHICITKPDENGYYPIHSSKFKRVYTGYSDYLKFLIKYEYIQRDYYEKDIKPYGYRLTEHFKEKIEFSRIICSEDISTRFKVIDDNSTCYIPLWIKDRIKKDFLSCKKELNLKESQLEKTYDQWNRFIVIQKWIHNNFELYKWIQRRRFFSWKHHRLYTNFVGLSSHVRLNNILLNNEKIIEFDIKSSYPLMLAKHCLSVNPGIIKDYDFIKYCTEVIDGKFYGKLAMRLNAVRNSHKKGIEEDRSTRLINTSDAKLLFQIYLNGDNRRIPFIKCDQTDIGKFMEFNYGKIHDIILDIKSRDEMVYDNLVEMETRLIFKIVEELYTKYDDIRILTCHDAIYVPVSYEERVREVWDSNMQSFIEELPYENSNEDPIEDQKDIYYESFMGEIIHDLSVIENEKDDYWGTPPYMIKQRVRLVKDRSRFMVPPY